LIDLKRVDPASGLTNSELMGKGRAPIEPDDLLLNLHHSLQTMNSLNHRILHIWSNAASKVHGSKDGVLRRKILDRTSGSVACVK